ncbi:MAG: PKD domain-containing protein, partial [Planctomycetota bacterium]
MFDSRAFHKRLLPVLLITLACGVALARQESVDAFTRGELSERSFRFSWRQDSAGAVNGTLVLCANGRIEGINSPNETFWEVDEEGRLLFKHEDGRVSTTYDEFSVRDGKYYFDGRFHFREGITHHLEEVAEQPRPQVELEDGLPERLLFSSQKIICLDPGEETTFVLGSGREMRLRLLSVEEHRDQVVHLIRRADVRVEIDGKPHDLVCAPYVMPAVIDGLRIQADTTSGFVELPKRVQFSLWDAAEPIIDTTKFGFPLRDFRLFSHGVQCYDEPVHLGRMDGDPEGGVFYHSYGIDFAGFEGGEDVVACVSGKVARLLPDAILVDIVDETGLIWEYHHLDSIAPHLEVGREVKKGERIGVLGRSGPSGNFSHLHVGAYLTPDHMQVEGYTRRLNYYPWMVEAYRHAHGGGPLAVAGPHHAAFCKETVVFDGSNSISAGPEIVSFEWTLPDGSVVKGARAEFAFDAPGVYVAMLRILDAAGQEDMDFKKVKVYTPGEPEPFIPTFFMTSTPTLEVYAGEPVRFRIWLHGAEEHPFEIDFGDGEVL